MRAEEDRKEEEEEEEEVEAVPLPHRSADRCLCRIGRAAFATGALLGG